MLITEITNKKRDEVEGLLSKVFPNFPITLIACFLWNIKLLFHLGIIGKSLGPRDQMMIDEI